MTAAALPPTHASDSFCDDVPAWMISLTAPGDAFDPPPYDTDPGYYECVTTEPITQISEHVDEDCFVMFGETLACVWTKTHLYETDASDCTPGPVEPQRCYMNVHDFGGYSHPGAQGVVVGRTHGVAGPGACTWPSGGNPIDDDCFDRVVGYMAMDPSPDARPGLCTTNSVHGDVIPWGPLDAVSSVGCS